MCLLKVDNIYLKVIYWLLISYLILYGIKFVELPKAIQAFDTPAQWQKLGSDQADYYNSVRIFDETGKIFFRAFRTPVYPLFLIFCSFFSSNLELIFLVQTVLYLAGIFFLTIMIGRHLSKWLSLLVPLLFFFDKGEKHYITNYTNTVLTEGLAWPLLLFILGISLAYLKKRDLKSLIILSVLIPFAVLTRPSLSILMFIPVYMGITTFLHLGGDQKKRWFHLVCAMVISCSILLSWLMINKYRTGIASMTNFSGFSTVTNYAAYYGGHDLKPGDTSYIGSIKAEVFQIIRSNENPYCSFTEFFFSPKRAVNIRSDSCVNEKDYPQCYKDEDNRQFFWFHQSAGGYHTWRLIWKVVKDHGFDGAEEALGLPPGKYKKYLHALVANQVAKDIVYDVLRYNPGKFFKVAYTNFLYIYRFPLFQYENPQRRELPAFKWELPPRPFVFLAEELVPNKFQQGKLLSETYTLKELLLAVNSPVKERPSLLSQYPNLSWTEKEEDLVQAFNMIIHLAQCEGSSKLFEVYGDLEWQNGEIVSMLTRLDELMGEQKRRLARLMLEELCAPPPDFLEQEEGSILATVHSKAEKLFDVMSVPVNNEVSLVALFPEITWIPKETNLYESLNRIIDTQVFRERFLSSYLENDWIRPELVELAGMSVRTRHEERKLVRLMIEEMYPVRRYINHVVDTLVKDSGRSVSGSFPEIKWSHNADEKTIVEQLNTILNTPEYRTRLLGLFTDWLTWEHRIIKKLLRKGKSNRSEAEDKILARFMLAQHLHPYPLDLEISTVEKLLLWYEKISGVDVSFLVFGTLLIIIFFIRKGKLNDPINHFLCLLFLVHLLLSVTLALSNPPVERYYGLYEWVKTMFVYGIVIQCIRIPFSVFFLPEKTCGLLESR